MPVRDNGMRSNRSVWMFMAATVMATTVSTLTATAMVKAESSQALEVTCECDAAEPTQCDAPTPMAPTPAELPAPPALVQQAAPAETPALPAPPAPAAMSIDGSIDKDIIRRVARAHIDEIRYCYNEGLGRDPELSGRVAVGFTIGAEGNVVQSEISSSDLGDTKVETCIVEAVARWKFPRPTDGQKVAVVYPFVLEPG